jgi:integrase
MRQARRAQLAQRLAQSAAAAEEAGTPAKSQLIGLSIQESTARQYASQLRLLEAFLVARGRRSPDDATPVAIGLTEEEYCAFLLAAVENGEKIPAQMHSALRKQQEILGLCLWAESPSILAAMRGARYRGGENASKSLPRGTLSEDMLQALRTHIGLHFPHMLNGVVVQCGCALRISQLITLRSGHVVLDPRRVWLEEDKRATAKNCGTGAAGPHFKEIWDDEAFRILWTLQAATPSGELLFPRAVWTVPQYRAALKATCAHLQFPPEFKFDGSHVLRHAGTAAAVRVLGPQDLSQHLRMSPAMVKHYSSSLSQRLAKKATKKAPTTQKKKKAKAQK